MKHHNAINISFLKKYHGNPPEQTPTLIEEDMVWSWKDSKKKKPMRERRRCDSNWWAIINEWNN